MAKSPAKDKPENFEEMLSRLEKIVAELERDDVPLEDAIRLYEEGQKIHQSCSGILDKAKLRIEKLSHAAEPGEEPSGVTDEREQETLF